MKNNTLNTMFQKFKLVFKAEEVSRISLGEKGGNEVIVVDVHGMKCSAAQRFVHNIITLVRESFELLVIHGYHHGTAIRDMLRNGFAETRILSILPDSSNDGRTIIKCGA